MHPPPRQPEELDSPWKEALEHFLEPFLALCFPEVHAGIDWRRGYQPGVRGQQSGISKKMRVLR